MLLAIPTSPLNTSCLNRVGKRKWASKLIAAHWFTYRTTALPQALQRLEIKGKAQEWDDLLGVHHQRLLQQQKGSQCLPSRIPAENEQYGTDLGSLNDVVLFEVEHSSRNVHPQAAPKNKLAFGHCCNNL